jgi:glucose-1-phosphate cytidylyltransferase
MKVVILAGGYGTRLMEETEARPKPMVEIGGKPLLWHIMKLYSHYGFNDFIICCGYKGYMIKEYFHNYYLHNSDMTIDLSNNDREYHGTKCEPWKVTLVDTGLKTLTGGRIKKIQEYVGDEPFMLTYGDGVSDVDIKKLVEHHKKSGKMVTVTSIKVASQFGTLEMDEQGNVSGFREKSFKDGGSINGGFFVCQPEVFKYIKDDETIWEQDPLKKIAAEGELSAYQHNGFWKCMDHLRDKKELEKLYASPDCPWKVWE